MIHGQSGLNLLADYRLPELDPREPWTPLSSPDAGSTSRRARRWWTGCTSLRRTPGGSPPFAGRDAACPDRLAGRPPRNHPLAAAGDDASPVPGYPRRRRPAVYSGWPHLDLRRREFRVRSDPGAGGRRLWIYLARDVAQDMVMYLRRPGGQLQFSRYSLQQRRIGAYQRTANPDPAEPHRRPVRGKFGRKGGDEPAQFHPGFTRDAGVSPARYVTEARPPPPDSCLSRPMIPLSGLPSKAGLAPALTYAACLRNSSTSRREYRQRFHCRKMA